MTENGRYISTDIIEIYIYTALKYLLLISNIISLASIHIAVLQQQDIRKRKTSEEIQCKDEAEASRIDRSYSFPLRAEDNQPIHYTCNICATL